MTAHDTGGPGPWTVGRFITSTGEEAWTLGRRNPQVAGLREPLLGRGGDRRKWRTQAAAEVAAAELNAKDVEARKP